MSMPNIRRPSRHRRRLCGWQALVHPSAEPAYRVWLEFRRDFRPNSLVRSHIASNLRDHEPIHACASGGRWAVFAGFEQYVALSDLTGEESLAVIIHDYQELAATDVATLSVGMLLLDIERYSLRHPEGPEQLRDLIKRHVDPETASRVMSCDVRSRAAFAASIGISKHAIKRHSARLKPPVLPPPDFVESILLRRSDEGAD